MTPITAEFTKDSATVLAQMILSGTEDREWMPFMSVPDTEDHEIELREARARLSWAEESGIDHIGIWKPQEVDGQACYVRDVSLSSQWRFWANRHVIPAKSDKKRIILLGESVARGYFYDPFYNPAMELQHMMDAVPGTNTEIIDLAKNGLNIEELDNIGQACLALQPDIIVVFAGNNWCKHLARTDIFSGEDLDTIQATLGDRGFTAFKSILEAKMRARIQSCVGKLADLASRQEISLVFVIPEFNLVDWQSCALERIVARLPGGDIQAWVAARDKAFGYLAENDFSRAAVEAAEMIQLDASNPLGYELLAQCKLANASYDEARALLESGRDAAMFCRVQYTPRSFEINRTVLKEEALRYNFSLVDLPVVLKEANGGKVPDRELFLDYCHLTVKGIRIAAAAISASILKIFKSEQQPAAASEGPSADVIGMANAFAAVHGSRYGQRNDLLQYYCMEAVKHSRIAAKFMLLFTSLATRKVGNMLCKNYEQIISDKMGEQYGNGTGLLHPENRKLMEAGLVDSMVEALRSTGLDIHQQVLQLRIKEHGAAERSINLLESYYQLFSNHQVLGVYSGHYTAHDSVSDFTLVSACVRPLELLITFRTPEERETGGKVVLMLNQQAIATFSCSAQWNTQRLIIPLDAMLTGINTIRLCWPMKALKQSDNDIHVSRSLSSGSLENIYSMLYPVFGEIHMFTVSETD